ncbi:MAG: LamG-like jellyroll fold domain-containing protein [Planctomycetota bacterium]
MQESALGHRISGPPVARFALLSFAAISFGASASARAAGAAPVISEFVASPDGSFLDRDGDDSDWIEIYNPGSDAVDLGGWGLTDDPGLPLKWRFPATALEGGGYLVVFASGKDRAAAGSELHTNFRLAAESGYLALFAPDGRTAASEFLYPPQRRGFSYGSGRKPVEPRLVARGSAARLFAPQDGSLGTTWTGGAEPFDDAPWVPVALGIGYPAGGGDPPPVPAAYYSFDGNAQDSSGGNHHGALRGGPVFSADVPPQVGAGSALYFDGSDDFVSAALDVSETEYTLSLWFKAESSGRGIFAVVGGDLGANGHDRHLYLSGGNIATRVWNNETIQSAGKNFADKKWHHAAHVFGGWAGGQRIYIDGQLVAQGAKAKSDFDWQEAVNIGFSNDAAAPYFHGRIDEVSIWNVALAEAQIRALAAGAHPLALEGFGPWVQTDVGPILRSAGASAYVRVPFALSAGAEFTSLVLRVRYDDGFAAYLNGVEVARRNAPAVLAFDSRAIADRPVGEAIRPVEIDLSSRLDLLRPGGNVLAFQLLNDLPGGADLLLDAELVPAVDFEGRYMRPPTPGAPNGAGAIDFVADTHFSVDRGFYDAPFDVEVWTETPGATILYTLDGSVPSTENPLARSYLGPIRISKTTVLRAKAFKEDHEPTNVDTHTYIFVDQAAKQPARPAGFPTSWSGFPADYEVDPDVVNAALPGYSFRDALLSIPTLSLAAALDDLFGASRGIYANPQGRGWAWERPASIELIRPSGRREFQADCGIRMHGNSSRDHNFTPKHPIRLLFRSRYGEERLRERVFPDSNVESFDELLLRGCSTDSWPVVDGGYVRGVQRWAAVHATYLRDQWMRDAQIALGHPSCHGIYVHLFLNGLYWGVYNLSERPVASFAANHLGGKEEEYDVLKDFAELDSGNGDAWNAMLALAGAGLASDAAYFRIQGRNPDGSRNPAYPVYLDVENLIDYMILHITSGAEDWPHHNWWGARRRGPESTGFKFFVWDQEISNDSLVRQYTLFETRFEDPVASPCPSYLYGQCMANPRFRREFGDRVYRHLFNGGALSPEVSSERWLARQRELDKAIVGESARWGDSKRAAPYRREVEWLAEMEWMRTTYWPQVRALAVSRFRRVGLYPEVEPPSFEIDGRPQHGGEISRGALLSMRVSSSPRQIEVPFVAADAPASAFVPADDRLGTQWRELGYAEGSHGESWKRGQNGVGYEASSGYESVIRIDVLEEMYGAGKNNSVYVRIPFQIEDAAAIERLDGLKLKVLYDDGFAAYLNGVRVADANAPQEESLAWNSGATQAGAEAVLSSPEVFDLSAFRSVLRPGANLLAVHGLNSVSTSSDMLILAELVGTVVDLVAPAGAILYTLDGRDPAEPGALAYENPVSLAGTTRVKARAKDGSVSSALAEAVYLDPWELPLRVSEIQYDPPPGPGSPFDADDFEFLEIVNAGTAQVGLEGVRLEGGVEFDFELSPVRTLRPGERLVVVENLLGFISRYGSAGILIAGQYRGRLANEGETLRLVGPIGETLLEFRWDPEWYPETMGEGPSLAIVDASAPRSSWNLRESWKPSAVYGGTPGLPEPDAPPGGLQRPGDANQDGIADISDAVTLLFHLFVEDRRPPPCEGETIASGGNLRLLDGNGDGAVDIADAIAALAAIFQGGPPHVLGARCVRLEGCPDACR